MTILETIMEENKKISIEKDNNLSCVFKKIKQRKKVKLLKNLCPICNTMECYTKKVSVKDGYATVKNGKYYFKETGMREKIIEWWSCKECCKKLSAKEYNNKMVEVYNHKNTTKS